MARLLLLQIDGSQGRTLNYWYHRRELHTPIQAKRILY
jgi:hypothetical protein